MVSRAGLRLVERHRCFFFRGAVAVKPAEFVPLDKPVRSSCGTPLTSRRDSDQRRLVWGLPPLLLPRDRQRRSPPLVPLLSDASSPMIDHRARRFPIMVDACFYWTSFRFGANGWRPYTAPAGVWQTSGRERRYRPHFGSLAATGWLGRLPAGFGAVVGTGCSPMVPGAKLISGSESRTRFRNALFALF